MKNVVLYLVIAGVLALAMFASGPIAAVVSLPPVVVQVLGFIVAMCQAMLPQLLGAAKAVQSGAKIIPFALVASVVLGTTACPQAAASIPADATLAVCVVSKAVAGESFPSICLDCAADAAAVAEVLLANPAMGTTKAMGDLKALQAAVKEAK
jgi:hypothetical protein